MGMGPEEAYFCSKFFNTLHAIEAPNFNRYDSSVVNRRSMCTAGTVALKMKLSRAAVHTHILLCLVGVSLFVSASFVAGQPRRDRPAPTTGGKYELASNETMGILRLVRL